MIRTQFLPAALALAIASLSPAQLPPPDDSAHPQTPPPATQPAKPASLDGELFPEIPPTTDHPKPKPKPTLPLPTTRPATPKPATRLPTPPPAPSASTTQPAAPAFIPTHRITLIDGRVLKGIPTRENGTITIKMELGAIAVDESKVQSIEPLNPLKK